MTEILDNIEQLGISPANVKQTGETVTTCVKCSHTRKKKRDKCLSYNHDKRTFICHHCGWSGIIKTADKKPKDSKPVEVPVIASKLSKQAEKYIVSSRGISLSTAAYFKLASKREWMPQFQKEVETIVFPYNLDGVRINHKYRGPQKSFKLDKGAATVLWNIDNILDDLNDLYITEGEFDAMAVHEAGITQVVSVPNGATTGNINLDYFNPVVDKVISKERIILLTDDDAAGQRLRNAIADRFGRNKCCFVSFGTYKDANGYLKEYGKEALKEYITNNITEFAIDGLIVTNKMKEMILGYDPTNHENYTIGFKSADNHWKLALGEWTVVTGMPASGKSEFVEQIILGLALREQFNVGLFVPESLPLEQHFDRIVRKYYKRNSLTYEERSKFFELFQHIFYYVQDEIESVEKVLEVFEALVIRKGVKLFYIDPFNFFDEAYDYKKIGKTLQKFTRFVKKYNVHIIIVAHPNKPKRDKDGTYFSVNLYDIAGSADFFNKTYNGLIIDRLYGEVSEANTDRMRVRIQKVKRKLNGGHGGSFDVYPDFEKGGIILDGGNSQNEPINQKIKPVQVLQQRELHRLDIIRSPII